METNPTSTTPCTRFSLEKGARLLSRMFNPLMVPSIAFLLIFLFTYLSIMPIAYKLIVLGQVFSFTLLMPALAIYAFQRVNGWGISELSERKRRFMPYALTIVSYVACLITMQRIHMPRYLSGIVVASLLCMLLCTVVNFRWKISAHVAGGGMLVGGLLSYGFLFNFNPVWWLCGFILLSGLLGTARIIAKQHTLLEVTAGFVVGLFCGVTGILFI